jgi:hypothetical protein
MTLVGPGRMCKSRILLNRGGRWILLDGLIGPFFRSERERRGGLDNAVV